MAGVIDDAVTRRGALLCGNPLGLRRADEQAVRVGRASVLAWCANLRDASGNGLNDASSCLGKLDTARTCIAIGSLVVSPACGSLRAHLLVHPCAA
jgi:hypothetical protein